MKNIKDVAEDVVAKIKAGDLYALLSVCDNSDLEPLVVTILGATTNKLDTNEKFKIHRPNHQVYAVEIGDEIRSFGGHSLRNLFRGAGPVYEELVLDVCKKLNIPCVEGNTVLNEERLLVNHLDAEFGAQSPEEREKALKQIRSRATSMGNNKVNLTGYAVAAVATMPLALTVGLSTAMGPAYRVTAPCVLHLAYLRKTFLSGLNEGLAGAVVQIGHLSQRLKEAAILFQEHAKWQSFVVCCWATGYALAVCDGPVEEIERQAISEFAAGASKAILPSSVHMAIQEIISSPPDFMGAMKQVETIGPDVWPFIDDLLTFVAEVDGPLNEFEEDFLDRWESYKRRKSKQV